MMILNLLLAKGGKMNVVKSKNKVKTLDDRIFMG